MSEIIRTTAEWCAAVLEALGLLIILAFALTSLLLGVMRLVQRKAREAIFSEVRQGLGHGILLGLEFLVAADIIHTVAVELTFRSVGILAIIVLIRTFLSFTLELEITGKWPWQKSE